MSLARPSASVSVPVGRQPMATISASQPELVCGPWRPMPPKTVMREQGRQRSGEEDGGAGAEELAGVTLHRGGHKVRGKLKAGSGFLRCAAE